MTDRPTCRAQITKQFLLECFDYKEGRLYWRHRPEKHFVDEWRQKIFNKNLGGKQAGCETNGYMMVRFSFGKVLVHRIVYLMHHGVMPPEIDHINGDTRDNRIENLREATHSQNCCNSKLSSANTSGAKGVSFHKPTGKWSAQIRVKGKLTHLGLFPSIVMAAEARKMAEIEHYGEFRRG